MRQIKFRGLRTDGKGWVYGMYLKSGINHHTKDLHVIYVDNANFQRYMGLDSFTVIPESVGQFTGLHDKNGVEIYERDIMTYKQVVSFETKVDNVCYGHGDYGKSITSGFFFNGYYGLPEDLEVIGNTHTQDGGQEG